jgi:transcriptional regulator with PAS, ATPase and Fis domain
MPHLNWARGTKRQNIIAQLGEGRWTDEQVVRHYLEQNGGSVLRAARAIGIELPSLWYHLRRLGMNGVPAEIRRARRAEHGAA